MIASFAAGQDWDGVWLFAYSHTADGWNAQSFRSFFDIVGNPAKWGFMPAGTAIFRDGGLHTLPLARTFPLTDLDRLQRMHRSDMLGVCGESGNWTWRNLLTTRAYCWYVSTKPTRPAPSAPSAKTHIAWPIDGKHGAYAALGYGGAVWVGHPQAVSPRDLPAGFPIHATGPAFAAVTLTAMDGLAMHASRRMLITACAKCENTDMRFTADRRSVGRNWGRAPVRIEPVSAAVALPAGHWTCQALSPDGLPAHDVPVEKSDDGESSVKLSPGHKTMWYLLTRP